MKVPIPNKHILNCIHFQTKGGPSSGTIARIVENLAPNNKLTSNQIAVGFVFIVEDVAELTTEEQLTKFVKKLLPDTEHLQ